MRFVLLVLYCFLSKISTSSLTVNKEPWKYFSSLLLIIFLAWVEQIFVRSKMILALRIQGLKSFFFLLYFFDLLHFFTTLYQWWVISITLWFRWRDQLKIDCTQIHFTFFFFAWALLFKEQAVNPVLRTGPWSQFAGARVRVRIR